MQSKQKAVKKDKPEKIPLDIQYAQRCQAGPAAFLQADGEDGAKLLRFAFDASPQSLGPYVVTDVQSLTVLVRAHLAIVRAAALDKPEKFIGDTFDKMILNFAHEVARGLHSHPGRYIHPDTGTRWVVAPQDHASSYLTSASTGRVRWMSAGMAHFSVGMGSSKLFVSQFVYDGVITTVAELLSMNSSAIREAFAAVSIGDETVGALVEIFEQVFCNDKAVIDHLLPQMLWPVADGYLALTAVPALAVINSLSAMRDLAPENHFVHVASYEIGSGKSQNQSNAAVGTSGNIPLLDCEPPRVVTDASSRLVRRAHAGVLLTKVGAKALKFFGTDVQALPNSNRAAFLNKAARWHVAEALSDLLDLRNSVEAGKVSVELLPESGDAQVQFVRGAVVTDAMANELARAVVETGPAALFSRHRSSDVVRYSEAVVAEIKLLGA